ncbi:MAG TPA: NAD(P)H-hydrate dehydratase [Gemmataceae bacterium]|nr:NAD(P)H-hydrate dehydratase [Gemmataceae bacterium]
MSALEVVTSLPSLPPRAVDSNKGQYGRVLIIAGSRGMSGAAVLCATAALRGGAGLVKVAVAAEILPIVAAGQPCCMTAALPCDVDGRISALALSTLSTLCAENDVIAIGPGLGRSADLSELLAELVAKTARPMVIDADGLNAFVGQGEKLTSSAGPRVITPHPGEFARLLQVDVPTVQANRRELAAELAQKHGLIVVLKGHQTVVTDGRRVYVNTTGNPGMATGGTGDVLTGLIAALLGQKLPPFEAAQLGVFVHGLAGDLARDQIGEVSLIATDLLDFLPAVLRGNLGHH